MGNEIAKVAVLLASRNGADFLPQQLQSLANQTHGSIDIWLSDDGSTDNTLTIAEDHARKWSKGLFRILRRPEPDEGDPSHPFDKHLSGSNRNFHSLVTNVNISADYYAFCDQDDIWEREKITRALDWLEKQDAALPAMYCSRTKIIDERGKYLGDSILFEKPPTFENAIIQNIAAGNTIVMNRQAVDALRKTMKPGNFVSHDWWVYILVTALGGNVKYDRVPTTCYRQHVSNLIGENASWRARMVRLRFVLEGRFSAWNDTNLRGLARLYPELPRNKRSIIDELRSLRQGGPVRRIRSLYNARIHRQTKVGQASLYLACLLGKI